MKKKIISISYDIPGYSNLVRGYSSSQSLLDADIIIFEPDFNSYNLDSGESYYNGKPCYSKDDSFRLEEDTQHWKEELATALKSGKTVFVFFKRFEESYIHTGQRQFSGTGRNARTTEIVTGYHNYNFFPFDIPTIVPKEGQEIVFSGNVVFSILWKEFKKYLEYQSYFDSKVDNPIFVTKTGEKPVGALFRVESGNLVLLPPLHYDEDKFVRYEKKEAFWTKEAIKFGKKLLETLITIDKELRRGGDKTPTPDWADDNEFELAEEKVLITGIKDKSQQIDNLVSEKNELISKIDKLRKLKDLLFEKSKILESAIISALEILGYKAENYDDGVLELDQVILSPEGDRFIGEAEGKDNSAISIDKFRQLSSNIQEDLQKEEVSNPTIGILFGNGYRLTKPIERKEQFTEKCINSAKSSNCILVRTSDLFQVVKYVKDSANKSFAKSCRDAIKNSIGKVCSFPEIPKKS